MKLAISNIAWDEKKNNVIYEIMKKYDITGLEIAPTKFFKENPYDVSLEEVTNLKKDIDSKKLEIVSMQSILFGKTELKMFESEKNREELLKYLKKAILFAKNLGIKNLVFGNPKNRILSSEEDRIIGIDFFKKLGDYAFENGICIGLETNPENYGTNYMTRTTETIDVIYKINSRGIKLNYDLGATLMTKENFSELKLTKDNISHVHISEPNLETISEANEEVHRKLFRKLKSIGYDNFISIEMKNKEEKNIERIEEVLRYISRLNREVENE